MSFYLRNLTVAFPTKDEVDQTNDFFFQVLVAEDAMMEHILYFPKYIQWIFIFLAWLQMVITSYFRFIVYLHLFQKYRKKEFNGINVLIFVEAVLEHSTMFTFSIFYTLVVTFDAPLEKILGPWFCYPITLQYRFVTFYAALGSLGISIYRILLLKQEILVK